MKRLFLLGGLALTMLLGACRETKGGGEQPIETFSSQKAPAQQTAKTVEQNTKTHQAAKEQPAVSITALDLLKQRVGRGVSETLLQRKAYTTSYNRQTRTPNWVAWTLTKDHTYGRLQRENERFEEDIDVSTPRATYQDYYNSRYDRGHMCPAGDNKWDQTALTESFLMTNICPQNHGLNKEDWNDLEMQCRTWARRFGEVTIVCGPLFEDAEGSEPRTIGRNKVRVPTGFFKVVYRPEPEPHAVGFIFRNNGSSQPWRSCVTTVDEVERRSGINFFLMLPDEVEQRVEAEQGLGNW